MCTEDLPLFNLEDNTTIFFFDQLISFNEHYTIFHRYLCLLVCFIGVILNSLHFYILTRKAMRVYIINALLCAMSICDIITMSSYFIYIFRFRILDHPNPTTIGYSYPWLIFLIVHVTASIALHTTSLYLSVIMAYIRWTALDRLDAQWIQHGALKQILLFTMLIVAIISIPNVMVHKIVSVNEFLEINDTINNGFYTVQLEETEINGCALFRLNLWITGIMFKALPCILILWFTIALIYKLCEMSKKRRNLRGETPSKKSSFHLLATSSCKDVLGDVAKRKISQNVSIDRTTLMLIIMLVVFLCTELPQGLLAILSAIYPTHVHNMIYVYVGELLDLMSLINCLTSFVVYCVMSTTYRATVKSIICGRIRKKSSKRKTRILLNSYKLQVS